MRKKKARNKTLQISLRVSEKELERIDRRAKLANINRTTFLVESALQKELTVVIFSDAKEIARRLTEVNTSLNRLKILVYQGKVEIVNLESCLQEVSNIWQLLNSLTNQTEVIKD